MSKSNVIYSAVLLTALGFIWGSGYSLAKYAMSNEVPALGYAFWQSLGPALLLSVICFYDSDRPLQIQKQHLSFYFICGFIGIAVPNTNMYFIAPHLPAGLLAVLVNTVPLLVYPLALIFKLERADFLRFLALGFGMLGIVMIIGLRTEQSILSSWSMMALLSPLAFALCSIYISQAQPKSLTNLHAARGMLLCSTLLLLPLIVQQKAFYPLNDLSNPSQQVVILEIFLSSIGYLLFFQLIRVAGPVFYSLTGGIVAITGLFWGYVIFGEQPSLMQSSAVACIIAAIFLISWRQGKQTQGQVSHVSRSH